MKRTLLALILIFVACPAWSAEWDKSLPAGTTLINDIDTTVQDNNTALDRLLANYRQGQVLTYASASTLTVTAGEITCSNSGGTVRKMRKNPSSTTVTWADIDTGSEASSTTYYVYASCDAVADTATYKISLSATTPTGLTSYKRIGSFYNDGSSDITLITNDNNYYAPSVGTSASKSSGVDYLALTDGVLSASCFGNGMSYSYIYTDGATSPTTPVTKCGVDASSNTDCSMSFLIKKNNYYRASCATSTNYIYFVPLSN